MSDNNITINTNQSPYFDDFDKTKNYQQVLYKPALPVQARELSTQQSITRDQIKRFGDHVFANGSRVSGGELFIDIKVQSIIVTNNGTGYTSIPTVTITGGGGTGATAEAVLGSNQTVIGINVINKGSGYTSIPSIIMTDGGGANAAATANLNTAAQFLGGERIVATDLSSAVLAASITPTGTGSSVSNDAGYYYFNGNFVRADSATIILDNYTNTPSYKIGFQVTEVAVNSGTDTTLLDNAQGSYNYAAPGADRLKCTLTLIKKAIDSTDDSDFIEVIRMKDGVRHIDNSYPIYSVLEETFARRTFDESGSYTVRHFPIQLKLHASDITKFTARLDPGKAYIMGHEFKTLVSADTTVDRARDYANVNNFDRLMQYGNFAKV